MINLPPINKTCHAELVEVRHTIESPDGGIGRRARLKIWFPKGSAGSIPVPGTLKMKRLRDKPRDRFFFWYNMGTTKLPDWVILIAIVRLKTA